MNEIKFNRETGMFVMYGIEEIGHISIAARLRDPTLGHKMAAAPEMFDALKGMFSPWDGFTKDELKRRHILGVIDTPDLIRILRAHDALARAKP